MADSCHRKQHGTIITLFAVSVCFVLFTSPICVNSIITFITGIGRDMSNPWEHISTILFELNYSFNFYLYCLTGSKVRSEVMKLFHITQHGSSPNTVTERSLPNDDNISYVSSRL